MISIVVSFRQYDCIAERTSAVLFRMSKAKLSFTLVTPDWQSKLTLLGRIRVQEPYEEDTYKRMDARYYRLLQEFAHDKALLPRLKKHVILQGHQYLSDVMDDTVPVDFASRPQSTASVSRANGRFAKLIGSSGLRTQQR